MSLAPWKEDGGDPEGWGDLAAGVLLVVVGLALLVGGLGTYRGEELDEGVRRFLGVASMAFGALLVGRGAGFRPRRRIRRRGAWSPRIRRGSALLKVRARARRR